jgi:hypothetical protein
MRIWLPILVLLLAAGGASAFYFQADGDEPSALDEHLAAEAVRLAANPDAIKQEDAAWIAKQLGDKPSAERLRELFKQRMEHILKEQAERLKKEFPQFYDYPAHIAKELKGSNGAKELEEIAELAELLRMNPRYKRAMEGGDVDYAALPAEVRSALLKDTEPVMQAIRAALAADHIVLVSKRQESWDDLMGAVDFGPMLNLVRTVVARAHIHAVDGNPEICAGEFKLAIELLSRVRMDSNLLGVLVHVVSNEIALKNGALPLASNEAIKTEHLREWMQPARSIHVDIAFTFAMDFADWIRIPGETLNEHWTDVSHQLAGDDKYESVEEVFAYRRKYDPGRFAVIEYAAKPRPRAYTAESLNVLHQLNLRTDIDFSANIRDAAAATWSWAGLEMRILERAHGPLHENRELVDAALEEWPSLRAKWDGNTLELWINEEFAPGLRSTSAIVTLPPK